MKKPFLFPVILSLFLFSNSYLTTAAEIIATPTNLNIILDGEALSFGAYNINGNNYLKLRDIAYALNNSIKQFEVEWDTEKSAISLSSNKPYTIAGGEMAVVSNNPKSAIISTSNIYLDGKEMVLDAYTIDGNNYFKLRDIASMVDFGVRFEPTNNTIYIETDKGYSAIDSEKKADSQVETSTALIGYNKYPDIPVFGENDGRVFLVPVGGVYESESDGHYSYDYFIIYGESSAYEPTVYENYVNLLTKRGFVETYNNGSSLAVFSKGNIEVAFVVTGTDPATVTIDIQDRSLSKKSGQSNQKLVSNLSSLYPNTNYRTFTDVTGTPLKEVYAYEDGVQIYIYDDLYVNEKHDNGWLYIDYLQGLGFREHKTVTDEENYTLTYFLSLGSDLFMVTYSDSDNAIYIIPPN